MRGVVFLGDRQVGLNSFPDPTPGPGEVVIEMKASGMCGSDLKFYRSAAGRGAAGARPRRPTRAVHRRPRALRRGRRGRAGRRRRAEAPIGQRVMDHHYKRLRRVQALPRRAGRSSAGRAIVVYGVTAQRRARRLPEGAGAHAGAAARRAVVRRRAPRSPAAPAPPTARCAASICPGDDTIAMFGQGPVGLQRTPARRARWARASSRSTSAPSGCALAQASSAPTR